MCFSFLPYITYFSHIFLSISNIVSTIYSSKITMTFSSMSAVRNAPGASITENSRFSVASISSVMSTNPFAVVGEITSDLFDTDLCFCMSATARTFIVPHHFCFRKISTCSAPCFWLLVIFCLLSDGTPPCHAFVAFLLVLG